MSAAGLSEFWSFQERLLAVDVPARAESWAAPVAKIVATDGFGENTWLDAIPDTVVAVQLGGSQVVKSRGLGAGRASSRGGSFALQPRGTDNHYSAVGSCTFAQILLSDRLLDRASELVGQPKLSDRLRPDLVFDRSPDLNGAATSYVLRALDARAPATNLEMEGRVFILLDKMLALHGSARYETSTRGGLAPHQLKRVTEYISDRLTEELSLVELADLVGLSAHHFCRVFKQSTGLPPHRWQAQARVERAKALMLGSDLSLADIALSAGFSDQSHFTTVFRKAVGATPHSWRRAART